MDGTQLFKVQCSDKVVRRHHDPGPKPAYKLTCLLWVARVAHYGKTWLIGQKARPSFTDKALLI